MASAVVRRLIGGSFMSVGALMNFRGIVDVRVRMQASAVPVKVHVQLPTAKELPQSIKT